MIGGAHTSPKDNEARDQAHHDEAHSFPRFMDETSWARKCQVSSIRRIRQTEHCTTKHQRQSGYDPAGEVYAPRIHKTLEEGVSIRTPLKHRTLPLTESIDVVEQ